MIARPNVGCHYDGRILGFVAGKLETPIDGLLRHHGNRREDKARGQCEILFHIDSDKMSKKILLGCKILR